MQRLCALIFFCLFLTEFVFAEPAKLNTSFAVISESGAAPINATGVAPREGFQSNLAISTARFKNGIRIEAQTQTTKSDYNNYVVQDLNGNENSLASTFDEAEQSATLIFDYASGSNNLLLVVNQSLTSSPLARQVFGVTYNKKLFNDLAVASISYSVGKLNQPENFYTNTFNGRRIRLPTQVNSNLLVFSYEQILTERFKAYFQFDTSSRTARPNSFGLTTRFGYALSSKDFIKYELARHQDDFSIEPTDNRGFFELLSSEIGYSRYITYDFFIAGSYGLTIESETYLNSTQVDQTSTDSYGLSLGYQGKNWKLQVNTQQIASNTSYQSSTYGGSLEWTF